MFEVGFTEIVLIVGLALLVLGPEKLPGLVQKVGRWSGRARSMARQLRTQLEHEVTIDELAKSRPMQASKTSTSSTEQTDPAADAASDSTIHTDPAPSSSHATGAHESAADTPEPIKTNSAQ